MDNRRMTISSEEQIGEALMRVSNTLEAQRLTKSLEYQEKLRRRTVLRMVFSVILAIMLLMLLMVGGLLLFVLWKYMGPIMDRVIPFLDKMLGDFGTIWDSLVKSSTYMPTFLDQMSHMLDELLITMQNMHGLPMKEILINMNNMLATTNGLMVGMGNMMNDLGVMAGDMFAGIGPFIDGLMQNAEQLGAKVSGALGPIMEIGNTMATKTLQMMQALEDGINGIDKETITQLRAAMKQMVVELPKVIGVVGKATEVANNELTDEVLTNLVRDTITGIRGFAKFAANIGENGLSIKTLFSK